jgi:hypothetical protein
MAVPADIAESNRVQTERLRSLARRLTPEMLAVRLPRGWTVAVALAHVAFWDRQRLPDAAVGGGRLVPRWV